MEIAGRRVYALTNHRVFPLDAIRHGRPASRPGVHHEALRQEQDSVAVHPHMGQPPADLQHARPAAQKVPLLRPQDQRLRPAGSP